METHLASIYATYSIINYKVGGTINMNPDLYHYFMNISSQTVHLTQKLMKTDTTFENPSLDHCTTKWPLHATTAESIQTPEKLKKDKNKNK